MLCAKIKDLKIILPLSVFQITFKKGHRSKANIAQGFRTEPHPNAPPIRMSLSLFLMYHILIFLSSFLIFFWKYEINLCIVRKVKGRKVYARQPDICSGLHTGASVLNGFSAFRDKGTHTARVFSPKDPKALFTQNRTVPKKFLWIFWILSGTASDCKEARIFSATPQRGIPYGWSDSAWWLRKGFSAVFRPNPVPHSFRPAPCIPYRASYVPIPEFPRRHALSLDWVCSVCLVLPFFPLSAGIPTSFCTWIIPFFYRNVNSNIGQKGINFQNHRKEFSQYSEEFQKKGYWKPDGNMIE